MAKDMAVAMSAMQLARNRSVVDVGELEVVFILLGPRLRGGELADADVAN